MGEKEDLIAMKYLALKQQKKYEVMKIHIYYIESSEGQIMVT